MTTCQVYLVGSEVPAWIAEPADVFASRVQDAQPDDLLVVTSIVTNDKDDEPYYEERTGYIRADQVSCITPLGPKAREHLEEARTT